MRYPPVWVQNRMRRNCRHDASHIECHRTALECYTEGVAKLRTGKAILEWMHGRMHPLDLDLEKCDADLLAKSAAEECLRHYAKKPFPRMTPEDRNETLGRALKGGGHQGVWTRIAQANDIDLAKAKKWLGF